MDKKFRLKATVIHSGGWKKLQAQQVNKGIFNKEISQILGIKPEDVHDMYGLVEQVGVVFIDCEEGNKHVPNFAEVIIRNPLTMKEVKKGEIGLIEILSILPKSYPGQALITEDLGLFLGADDCKCGRKGTYFKFISRVEESEARGCGDTYFEKKK
jgi:phenylacetate-coenzyme A ligase PaaK-like adenylate-forming protein